MIRHRFSPVKTALTVLVVVGVGCAGVFTATSYSVGASEVSQPRLTEPGHPNVTVNSIELAIDCNQSQVAIAAPPERQYRISVAVVNLTPTTSRTLRTTSGPFTGNATVNITGTGAVFAFAMNEFEGVRPVARAFAYCGARNESNATTLTTDRSAVQTPSIRVNCTAERVQFTALTQYVASIAVVDVSPTQSSVTRLTRTLTGNTTVAVENTGGVIAVFTSSESLGDESTMSAIRNCGPSSQNVIDQT